MPIAVGPLSAITLTSTGSAFFSGSEAAGAASEEAAAAGAAGADEAAGAEPHAAKETIMANAQQNAVNLFIA